MLRLSRSFLLIFANCIVLYACSGPSFRPVPLPPLAIPEAPARPIDAPQLLLAPGEHFTYDVRLHGIAIGRVELSVSDSQVASRFKTTDLASAFANASDELVTTLDRPNRRAAAATESLVIGDDAKTFNIDPTVKGNPGQTVHTALGLIRAWAKPDAAPGFVLLGEAGKLWRLDLLRPTHGDLQGAHALRVDGHVSSEKPIQVVLWLSDDDQRVPLRIELTNDDFHVVAELVRE